jgi:DNA-binding transcriptional regulator YiaG
VENTTQMRTCVECGGELRRKMYKHETKVGRYTVVDSGGFMPVCESCGAPDLTLEVLAKIERRAAKVALLDLPAIEGEVLRFARKALGLRQQDLAAILDRTPETISRWESGAEPISKTIQLAVAQVIDVVEQNGPDYLAVLLQPNGPESGNRLYVKTGS